MSTTDAVLPQWGSRHQVRVLLGLPYQRLRQLVEAGFARSVKLGAAQQASRLYNLADLNRALIALAEGREPSRAPRTVNRRQNAAAGTAG